MEGGGWRGGMEGGDGEGGMEGGGVGGEELLGCEVSKMGADRRKTSSFWKAPVHDRKESTLPLTQSPKRKNVGKHPDPNSDVKFGWWLWGRRGEAEANALGPVKPAAPRRAWWYTEAKVEMLVIRRSRTLGCKASEADRAWGQTSTPLLAFNKNWSPWSEPIWVETHPKGGGMLATGQLIQGRLKPSN